MYKQLNAALFIYNSFFKNINHLRIKSNAASPNNIISDHIELELQAGVNRAIETLHLATNNEMTTQKSDKCDKDCNNT